ncbi:MAG: SRPBCC family protein [Ignavibacterium sp.]|nr:MAG: SRPBCC family protein [Ignavibacterium sp.]
MKYSIELIINKSRDKVWDKFDSVENFYKWQPTLTEFIHESGEAGQPGAKSRLKYRERNKDYEMTETITSRKKPEEFSGTYEMKGTKNFIKNKFTDVGEGKTKWELDSEFEFGGIFKLISPLMKGMIVKRTKTDMNRFKDLVEGNLG